MFGWIFSAWRNWRERRALRRDRMIFEFFDGERIRYGDPLRIWREILADKEFSVDTIDAVDRNEEPETTHCINCCCRVFGLKKLDPATGKGLTDAEIENVLSALVYYLDNVKKNFPPGPTLPTNTAPESSNGLGDRDDPTKALSGSGSTSIDPRQDPVSSSCEPCSKPTESTSL